MESRQKEEFELKVLNGGSMDNNEHNEKSLTRQVCKKYGFITKHRPSQNHQKRRWQYLRKQTLETSITEQRRSSPGNKTKYTYLRTNCITKKTWLLLQRIALIFLASSLVLITNMGTTIIYLKDVIPINHPGDEKLFVKIKSTNVLKPNSINTVPSNDVPNIAALNFSRDRGTEFKSSEKKPLFSCYESFDKWEETLENARFAIESVSLPTLGILGLLANAIVIFVLFRVVARKDLQGNQKNFDKLLICLSFIDSFLIVIYIVDALIQIDILHEPQWYQVIYPHFWYPMKMIMTTSSQCMVAAVSVERYIAICHKTFTPPKHKRILFWVVTFSLLVNIPRFCEFVSHQVSTADSDMAVVIENESKPDDLFSLRYHTSRLGENPEWLLFASYHEIAVIAFSLATICFCNLKVWLEVDESANLNVQRHVGRTSPRVESRSQSDSDSVDRKETTVTNRKRVLRLKVDVHIDDDDHCISTLSDKNEEVEQSKSNIESSIKLQCQNSDHQGYVFNRGEKNEGGDEVTGGTDNTMKPKTRKEGPKVRAMGNMEEKHRDQKPRGKSNLNVGLPNTGFTSKRKASKVELKASGEVSIQIAQNPDVQTEIRRNNVVKESKSRISTLRQYSKTSSESIPEDDGSKNHFRKRQSKSTLILFGIVLIFLICNIPRLGVKIFHIYHQGRSVQKHFNACAAAGRYHAPVAIVIMGYVNHLLLVLNSSTNFIVYCCFAKRFRAEIVRIAKLIIKH